MNYVDTNQETSTHPEKQPRKKKKKTSATKKQKKQISKKHEPEEVKTPEPETKDIPVVQLEPIYEQPCVNMEETVMRNSFLKEQLKVHLKQQVKNFIDDITYRNTLRILEEPEKPEPKKYEYSVCMIDWNNPDTEQWSYDKMGLDGWELCNVEFN